MFRVITAILLAMVAQEATAVKIPAALDVVSLIFRFKFFFSNAKKMVNLAVFFRHAAAVIFVTMVSASEAI